MTTTVQDIPLPKLTKIAGAMYLITFFTVVTAYFGIHEHLMVEGNTVQTAQNIITNQHLFRLAIVCDLMYAAGFTVLLLSLYRILYPINKSIATIAAFWQLLYAAAWVTITYKLFEILRILNSSELLGVFDVKQVQMIVNSYPGVMFDRYYGGLPFYALGSVFFSYLWLKSGYIPKLLASASLISTTWCAICAIVFLIVPEFRNIINIWLFDSAMALCDLTIGVWLLIKGLRHRSE